MHILRTSSKVHIGTHVVARALQAFLKMLCWAKLFLFVCSVVLCYAMSCYVMLCYASYAMSCYVMLVMLCCAMLCYAVQAFLKIDADRSGFISPAELSRVFESQNLKLTPTVRCTMPHTSVALEERCAQTTCGCLQVSLNCLSTVSEHISELSLNFLGTVSELSRNRNLDC